MSQAAAIHPHARPASQRQVVLSVELEAPGGLRWRAIGGGASLADAITFARESAPDGHYWRVVRVTDLYGD
jgi:hypothetical protein